MRESIRFHILGVRSIRQSEVKMVEIESTLPVEC